MESSGWTDEEMHDKYTALGHQKSPVYWPAVDDE